ncbi:hypothetical protein DL98DRAFT_648000 [Cadophora sp. DSE1049]|nr:hypothetical protein DL98DRAFT_648000 [Cadophora sp. DSE1049]
MARPSFKSSRGHKQYSKHLWLKISPVLALTLTIAAALCLLILKLQEWRSSENFAQFVIVNRTTIAISVQIIAHLLGLLQLTAICVVLKLSFSQYSASNSVQLSSLHFTSAIYSCTTTWSLPIGLSSLSVIFIAFTLFPAALWSGSITPLLDDCALDTTIQAPTFQTSNISSIWDADKSNVTTGSGRLGQWQTDLGLFSFDPSTLRGLLLSSASSASARNGTGTPHAKLDKTGFVYTNRSYGMGSAAGFITTVTSNPLSLSYLETGFESTVSCVYNRSSQFRLVALPNPNDGFRIFQPKGSYFKAQDETAWGVSAGYVPDDMFSWVSEYSADLRSIFIPMTTAASSRQDDWGFLDFNATQCQVQFTMRNFNVVVDYTSKQIDVTPADPVSWANYGDAVVRGVASWLRSMSSADGFVGGSQLGRSLRLNVEALQSATNNTSEATRMQGIADHIASLVDNIIIALLSTRYVAGKQSAPLETQVTVLAIVYGDLRYIIAVLVLNILILLLFTVEAVRTRLWESLPEEDLLDISSLIVGITEGHVKLVDVSDDKKVNGSGNKENIQLVVTSASDRIEGSKDRLMENLTG